MSDTITKRESDSEVNARQRGAISGSAINRLHELGHRLRAAIYSNTLKEEYERVGAVAYWTKYN